MNLVLFLIVLFNYFLLFIGVSVWTKLVYCSQGLVDLLICVIRISYIVFSLFFNELQNELLSKKSVHYFGENNDKHENEEDKEYVFGSLQDFFARILRYLHVVLIILFIHLPKIMLIVMALIFMVDPTILNAIMLILYFVLVLSL